MVKRKKSKTGQKSRPLTSSQRRARKRMAKVMNAMVVEGKTQKDALLEAGYSQATADSGYIRTRKVWADLREEMLPDDKLLDIHNKLLNQKQTRVLEFPPDIADEVINDICRHTGYEIISDEYTTDRYKRGVRRVIVAYLDASVVANALALAYKIKGYLTDINITLPNGESYEQLQEEKKVLLARYKKLKGTKTDEKPRERKNKKKAKGN